MLLVSPHAPRKAKIVSRKSPLLIIHPSESRTFAQSNQNVKKNRRENHETVEETKPFYIHAFDVLETSAMTTTHHKKCTQPHISHSFTHSLPRHPRTEKGCNYHRTPCSVGSATEGVRWTPDHLSIDPESNLFSTL